MDASSEQHQPVSSLSCPGCGSPLMAATAFCPTCGRPLAPTADASSARSVALWQSGSAQSAALDISQGASVPTLPGQTYPNYQPSFFAPYQTGQSSPSTPGYPTQPGVWASQNLPTPTGMEALGATATVAPSKPMRSHRLRNTLTLISAVVIVALLAGGAYYLYAAFFNSPQAAARILPDRTFVYVSVDLTAVANNNHHVTIDDLARLFGVGAALKQEGLNWQQDVAPWVGRNVAIAAYPTSNDSATLSNVTSSSNPVTTAASVFNFGLAELFQSRDDAKAQAAMAKAANAQKQHGQTVKQISYGGMTLYSVTHPGADANGASTNTPAQTLFAGKGWAVIASSLAAAEIIVDRINGQGTTLSSAPSFQDATNNLPSSRFSTLYLNLREYYNLVISLAPSPTQGLLDFPFVDTYPVAGGYITWSSLGMRAQLTFNAVKSAGIPNVSGNTINLTQYAPANTLSYSGVGNLGAFARAYVAQLPSAAKVSGTAVDPLQQAFGISSNAPVVQQPAATISFAQGKTTASALLLHTPNASAAQSAFATIAHKNHWTLKPTTVDHIGANAIYASETSTVNPTTGKVSASNSEVGIEAIVGQTLVIVTAEKPATALDAIIKASQNLIPSLAGNANFQTLVSQAPTHAATMTYYNLTLAEQLSQQNGGQRPTGLATRIPALLTTLVWNAQVNQTTTDVIIK